MCRWVFGVEIGRLPFILYFCAEKMNDMAENDVEQLLAGIEYPDDLRRLTPDKLERCVPNCVNTSLTYCRRTLAT